MIVIVPARGGSKGLPGKNIRLFGGVPLIEHTLRAALAARSVDRVLVSTDDDEILRVARAVPGVEAPVRRPQHLATDDSSALDAYLHLIDSLEIMEGRAPESVCVLLPTSPLRRPEDIDAAIQRFMATNANSVISVSEAKPSAWLHHVDDDGRMERVVDDASPLRNRQDHEKVYLPNGSIYVFDVAFARATGSLYGENSYAYLMPPERSVDIDTEADFVSAEALYNLEYDDVHIRRLHRAV